MPAFHLDLLHPRRPPGPAAWAVGLGGAVLLLAELAWDGYAGAEMRARRIALDRELTAAQAAVTSGRPVRAAGEGEAVSLAWQRAMRVAADLNAPWSELFHKLEREVRRPVGLLALDVDAGRHSFLLSAEARNFDEMLAYLRFLQDCGQLSGVVLDAHQVNRQDSEKPLRFRVTAHWAPPGTETAAEGSRQ